MIWQTIVYLLLLRIKIAYKLRYGLFSRNEMRNLKEVLYFAVAFCRIIILYIIYGYIYNTFGQIIKSEDKQKNKNKQSNEKR